MQTWTETAIIQSDLRDWKDDTMCENEDREKRTNTAKNKLC